MPLPSQPGQVPPTPPPGLPSAPVPAGFDSDEPSVFAPAASAPAYPAQPPAVLPAQPAAAAQAGLAALPPAAQHAARALMEIVGDDECSEVLLNGPNDVLKKVRGLRIHVASIRFGDPDTYHRVLNEVLLPYTDTADRIDGSVANIEGQLELPSGQDGIPPALARVHVVAPPFAGVPVAKVTIAKKARVPFTLDNLPQTGSLSADMARFLKNLVRSRATIVVSGPTGAGKSTVLQAMTHEYDINDRVVVVEDVRELQLPLADVVYMRSTFMAPGVDARNAVSTELCVKMANRMRMDRILVGECRGAEFAEWLIAANSGAEGSATTIHAESPRRTLDKMVNLGMKSPTAGGEQTLRREIAATVDVIVQAGLVDGQNRILAVEEISKVVRDNGIIATTTLFQFDRATGRHEAVNQPSEELQTTMRMRGVPPDLSPWQRPRAR